MRDITNLQKGSTEGIWVLLEATSFFFVVSGGARLMINGKLLFVAVVHYQRPLFITDPFTPHPPPLPPYKESPT
jgi:hypothetical protein